ncbi:hypothetical protein HK096_004286, partial [Nowakowskiella sp. JEL0078]
MDSLVMATWENSFCLDNTKLLFLASAIPFVAIIILALSLLVLLTFFFLKTTFVTTSPYTQIDGSISEPRSTNHRKKTLDQISFALALSRFVLNIAVLASGFFLRDLNVLVILPDTTKFNSCDLLFLTLSSFTWSIISVVYFWLSLGHSSDSQPATLLFLEKVLIYFNIVSFASDLSSVISAISENFLYHILTLLSYNLWISISLIYLEYLQKNGNFGSEKISATDMSADYSGPLIPCRKDSAGFISKCLFFWIDEIIWTGSKKVLESADVPDLPSKEKAQNSWAKYKSLLTVSTSTNIFHNLIYSTYQTILIQQLFGFLSGIFSILSPYFLNRILVAIQSTDDEMRNEVWKYLVLMFIVSSLKAIFDGQAYFNGRRVSTQWRGIIFSELFNKVMKRPISYGGAKTEKDEGEASDPDSASQQNVTIEEENGDTEPEAEENVSPKKVESSGQDASLGQIINLQSTDTEMIVTYVSYSHEVLFKIPLALILSVTGLFLVVGWSALVGLSIIIISGPVTIVIMQFARKIQQESQAASDKRVNLINEVLQGIRVVKYLAWEPEFKQRINKARESQITTFFRMFWVNVAVANVNFSSSIFVMVATFACFTGLQGGELNPAVAFTAMILLRQTSELLQKFPQYLNGV